MNKLCISRGGLSIVVVTLLFLLPVVSTQAAIDGITGTTFSLSAKSGYIMTGEGNSVFMWGFANGNADMQYPGPTLIVDEGVTVNITLTNNLPVPVSIVFPGHQGVAASGGIPGLLTQEAPPNGGTVSYSFVATKPGTYLYHSGTRPDLQIEMGLVGTIIVRPSMGTNYAYNHADTQFDHEYLFFHTEIDPRIHELVESGRMDEIDNTTYWPVYWFLNGRNFPDTIIPANVSWLPNQPYNSLPMMHPGERLLLRIIGAGRDLHPFHTHGNNALTIARDGRLLTSDHGNPAVGPDIARSEYTVPVAPGETIDAIFEWTGKNLGWDIYGPIDNDCTDSDNDGFDDVTLEFCHDAICTDLDTDGFDDSTFEYCLDHGNSFPVILPDQKDLTLGEVYSGSPFLGQSGPLPPDHVNLNPYGAFVFPWHSHLEREVVNNDIFMGGMVTLLFILPPGTPIP